MKQTIYHTMAEVEATHWWFVGRRRIVDHVLAQRFTGNRLRILEIGCGTGGNFALLGRYGTVSATDSEETALGYARSRGGADVQYGALPDQIPFAAGSFDLVVLTDVLEHVAPDAASLVAIEALLAPGGTLLITVPALPMLWSDHDESHHHQRRYTRTELRTKTQAAALRIELLSYYNTLLFPVVAMVRWLERVTGRSADADLQVPTEPVNRILAGVLGSERYLIGRVPMPIGVSLIMVARKHG